jgi:hypothetical protein
VFSFVSVDCLQPLPMGLGEVSLRSTFDVLKDIWNGFILAEPSGYFSGWEPPGETSGDASKWDRTSGEHEYS